MDKYGKETLKENYKEELKQIYKGLLEEQQNELEKTNELWKTLQEDMLRAIALYDIATTGGVNKDLNTLNVEIITKVERFKSCDEDVKRKNKVNDIQSNIKALKRLVKQNN